VKNFTVLVGLDERRARYAARYSIFGASRVPRVSKRFSCQDRVLG
jgi:hypothetical protein